MSRYVIIGAGAVGGAVAGLLADAGIDVVAVARGTHAGAMQRRGLTIRTPARHLSVPVRCITDPADIELSPDDVLVLTTKTQQAHPALRQWVDAPVGDGGTIVGTAGERLPILTALNGVAGERLALRYFERVIGVGVWMPVVHLEPGEVILRTAPERCTFVVGPRPAERDESQLLDRVERDWTRAGFRIVRPDDVMPWKYHKLIINIGNAFQALIGGNGPIEPLVGAARDEARRVLDAAGIEVVDDRTAAAERDASGLRIEEVPGQPDELGGSTWQSLARRTGDIESDYINGEIALVARCHGLSAPINAGVARLARRAAIEGRAPGDISAAELAERLGL